MLHKCYLLLMDGSVLRLLFMPCGKTNFQCETWMNELNWTHYQPMRPCQKTARNTTSSVVNEVMFTHLQHGVLLSDLILICRYIDIFYFFIPAKWALYMFVLCYIHYVIHVNQWGAPYTQCSQNVTRLWSRTHWCHKTTQSLSEKKPSTTETPQRLLLLFFLFVFLHLY